VALADKLDSLTGFFAIGEKPTGSGDPYALRRAALGVIRIVRVRSHSQKAKLSVVLAFTSAQVHVAIHNRDAKLKTASEYLDESKVPLLAQRTLDYQGYLDSNTNMGAAISETAVGRGLSNAEQQLVISSWVAFTEVLDFILERLRVSLRDEGFAPDVIEAAFAIPDDDIVRIVSRVTALAKVLKTEDGVNLVAGLKRGANILRAEEKKGQLPTDLAVNSALLQAGAEQGLYQGLEIAKAAVTKALGADDFDAAMVALAQLRQPVDAFFDTVLINDPDAAIRLNRLALLVDLQSTSEQIADFSKLAG
jgi:glycyl-tRNA synthetase beta chain